MIIQSLRLTHARTKGFSPVLNQSFSSKVSIRPTTIGLSIASTKPRAVFTRNASTVATESPSLVTRMKNLFYGTSLILGFGLIYFYITDTRASAHRWIVVPALRLIYSDAEDAHHTGNLALKGLWQFGLHPRERGNPDQGGDLKVEVFGHSLMNPIATSAGIDKHADIPYPLFALGPSIIELGGATPLPQNGNEKPRVFRVASQKALINRYGLNSEGADHVAMRLRQRVREYAYSQGLGHDLAAEKLVLNGHTGVPPGSLLPGKLLAVNIAKNKFTPENEIEAVKNDYKYCVDRLAPYADILVVNVSSPNTPGLRTLQESGPLTKILTGVVQAAKEVDRKTKPAVMVKVSPDEDSDDQIAGICQAVWDSGVDGVIVGNTTNRRPNPLPTHHKLSPAEEEVLLERGGFSGPHLFERTVRLVKKYRKLLDERPHSSSPNSTSPSRAAGEPQDLKPSSQTTEEISKSDDTKDFTASDAIDFKEPSLAGQSEKQPFSQLPDRNRDRLRSIQHTIEDLPASENASSPSEEPKVIFATGGITNGRQALEVLNAGASVAMVYTALVYGGVGTISKIKDEMRYEMGNSKAQVTPK